jgi:hypothetical protein
MVPRHGHVNLQHVCLHMFIKATCILGKIIFLVNSMLRKWPLLVNVAPLHIVNITCMTKAREDFAS